MQLAFFSEVKAKIIFDSPFLANEMNKSLDRILIFKIKDKGFLIDK